MKRWIANKLRAWAQILSPAEPPPPFRLDVAPDPGGEGYIIEFRPNSSGTVAIENKCGGGSIRRLEAGDLWRTTPLA